MSSLRRARSDSVASTFSRRLRSRITFCDSWGFDQRLGSDAFFSTSASWERSRSASKILPEVAHLLLQRGVFLFQFFDHNYRTVLAGVRSRTESAPSEIIAQP